MNLVAAANGDRVWIFNRKTGEPEPDRIDAKKRFKDIERLLFSPKGDRLLVVYKHPQRGELVEAVPIRLNAEELKSDGGAVSANASQSAVAKPESFTRVWKDKTGQFQIEATLLSVAAGQASFKKADGSRLTVPVEAFGEDEQRLMKSHGVGP
ncbi:MAG: SHD1 domain-containing protein [Pirellulales bacterium]